tara:strand:- start:336 stop:602 length:267 start_codon:yes stop_codon:yes gene_type:complete
MKILMILLLGVVIGVLIKVPFLIKYYTRINLDRKEMEKIVASMDGKEYKSTKVLRLMHSAWAGNWDLFTDFLGKEVADKVDDAVGHKE